MAEPSNNKRIAKNAVMLYIRMFIAMAVGLYTSRIVLATLGVEDYGIYSIVGSIVAMMGFLNAAMAGATSRFLTVELGKGDLERLTKTFSSAMMIHILIAIVVLIVSETIGLWFLCNKLVIPAERMEAAHWVYQLSILGSVIAIIQVPYNASIISHERMDLYAYVEILNVSLKLLIVYLLLIAEMDKLIVYAILMLVVSFIIFAIYYLYCKRNFRECFFRWMWDRDYIRPMLSFSGWDLFSNMAVTTRQQGTNFLVNMFFGVAFNAASGVATTVVGMTETFAQNILNAFRPQIIKYYAAGDYGKSVNLIYNAGKWSGILIVLVAIPLSFEIDYIMYLWLGNPPEYAALFCKIMIVSTCIYISDRAINAGIFATGHIRKQSVYASFIYLTVLVFIYISYKLGLPVETAYYLSCAVYAVTLLMRLLILKQLIPTFSLRFYLYKVILPILFIATLISIPVYFVKEQMSQGFFRLVVVGLVDILVGGISVLLIALDSNQRSLLYEKAKAFFPLKNGK